MILLIVIDSMFMSVMCLRTSCTVGLGSVVKTMVFLKLIDLNFHFDVVVFNIKK